MVYKMINSRYRVFIESFIFAALIMLIGFILGFYVESYRVEKAVEESKNFEIEALDLKLQNYYYQMMNEASCTAAINQNFIFADDIYEKGLLLERYEEANQLNDEIKREKKRYVLLKTELWLNSILLKEKCGGENKTFHTLVYIYSDNQNDLAKKGEQMAVSNILGQIKEEYGNRIILLPIAGDLGLNSIELQRRIYKIDYLPSLIIDEEEVIEGFSTKDKIESFLK